MIANLISTVAGIPLGFILHTIGIALGKDHSFNYPDINIDSTFWVDQIFVVGLPPIPNPFPTLGDPFNSLVYAGTLIFIACYLPFTILVEGWYLRKQKPELNRRLFWKKIISVHMVSYLFLASLWFPYTYVDARKAEEYNKWLCSQPPAGNKYCKQIWGKYPESKEIRIKACESKGISQDDCFRL